MQKKYLISFVFQCLIKTIICQDYSSCDLVKVSFESNQFQKDFLKVISDSSIIVFDKKQVTTKCLPFIKENKQITITMDSQYANLLPGKYMPLTPPNLLVLYNYSHCNEHDIALYYWRPYTGASAKLLFRNKRNKLKLISYDKGTF